MIMPFCINCYKPKEERRRFQLQEYLRLLGLGSSECGVGHASQRQSIRVQLWVGLDRDRALGFSFQGTRIIVRLYGAGNSERGQKTPHRAHRFWPRGFPQVCPCLNFSPLPSPHTPLLEMRELPHYHSRYSKEHSACCSCHEECAVA